MVPKRNLPISWYIDPIRHSSVIAWRLRFRHVQCPWDPNSKGDRSSLSLSSCGLRLSPAALRTAQSQTRLSIWITTASALFFIPQVPFPHGPHPLSPYTTQSTLPYHSRKHFGSQFHHVSRLTFSEVISRCLVPALPLFLVSPLFSLSHSLSRTLSLSPHHFSISPCYAKIPKALGFCDMYGLLYCSSFGPPWPNRNS